MTTEKDYEKAIEALLGCGALMLLLPAAVLMGAFTLQRLWLWFIVPTFDAKPLTFAAAIGVDLVFSILQTQPYRTEKPDETMSQKIGLVFGRAVAWPLCLLFIGVIAKRFL